MKIVLLFFIANLGGTCFALQAQEDIEPHDPPPTEIGARIIGKPPGSEENGLFSQFIADINSKRDKNCLRQNNAVLRTAALLSGPKPTPDRAQLVRGI